MSGPAPAPPDDKQEVLRALGNGLGVFADQRIERPRTNAEVCHNINLYWKKRLRRRYRVSPMGF